MSDPKNTPSNPPPHLRGMMYFAVPSSIQGRQHLAAFEFDGIEEWGLIHAWGINRGYLPALPPQLSPGITFDASMSQKRSIEPPNTGNEAHYTEDGAPICPVHPGGMLESSKIAGGYYCGRKDNGRRCGWEWTERRGLYQTSAKGAARK